mgnify:CR=1 FL=1
MSDPLKLALITEARNWKLAFSKALNEKCAQDMDEILEFIDNQVKYCYVYSVLNPYQVHIYIYLNNSCTSIMQDSDLFITLP